MSIEAQDVDGFKAVRTPYLKFYTDDWRSGTLGLSFELKGFYIDLLALMWDRKSALPNNPELIARSIQCDPRKVRRLINELIATGKLKIEGDELTNRRMEHELKEHSNRSSSARDRRDIARKSKRSPAEVQEKSEAKKSETQAKTTNDTAPLTNARVPLPESISSKESNPTVLGEMPRPPPSIAALPSGFLEKITEAAGPCLDNPVNCLGLLSSATVSMWISQGCEPELDILPTIAAAAVKYRGKRVRDWGYFTGMIAEAKAKRLAGLPAVDVKKAPAAVAVVRELSERELMARTLQRFEQEGYATCQH